jgi:hypothetical protein
MVRLLQIAGIGALLVAGVVLASLNPWRPLRLLHLGISQDPEAAKFLNAEGAVTRFNTRKDSQVSDNQDKTPPLVRQAQTLESIINPRVSPTAPVTAANTRAPSTAVLRPPSPAKFDLVGISYLQSNPENSFAYIRLPDNTFQWVRQGSEVGHLTIKQVKNDSIICSDGQRMSEMKVAPAVDTASMLEVGAVPSDPAAAGLFKGAAAQPVSQPGARASLSDRITAGSPAAFARLSAEEEASLRELANRVKELKAAKSNQVDSNATSAEVDKLISEAKSSRISAEEAQKLEKLGEQLVNGTKDTSPEEKRRELPRRMSPPRPPKQ